MALIHETLSDQFYQWEMRGRGWNVWPLPVSPEPPFQPFLGHYLPPAPSVDDGRRPTFLSSLVSKLSRALGDQQPPPPAIEPETEPEPRVLVRSSLVELQTSLPAKLDVSKEAFDQFLRNLSLCREPLAFELIGTSDRVRVQFAAGRDDAPLVRRQLQAYFPEAVFQPGDGTLEAAWESSPSDEMLVVEFGLEREFMFPLLGGKLDPFIGMVGALSELHPGEIGVFQVLFEPAREEWADSIVNSVTGAGGKPFFVNMPELAAAGENKIRCPLYGAVVRIAVKSASYERAVAIARDLAGSLRVFAHPQGNRLIPLANDDYPLYDHVDDMLCRQSRRSGMLLNSDELIGFVHFPSTAVRSEALKRDTGKTKAAPAIARNAEGMLLGHNVHFGESAPVRLTPEQRVQHMHVIGASGTGKSTLLLNLIRQNIEDGEGVAVLDPHGDLVEQILGIIPSARVNDVVLIDPSDEEYSVGFNILSAHSDLEKNLLASDLISVFQRLSTSWGDQMEIVLQNAILAFLESDQGGTLADLRRFLIEPAFREKFLSTVRDPDIVYYWRKAFAQLSGNKSIGPVLTRLETFLAPKPIRYMVTQRENRLDFGDIMDSGKIFLAKLPHGQMGKENSFLLGSLLVSKFQQLAMGRQAQRIESRRPFYLYIDEFQNFITPSMSEILSGARKYRLGLVLAHQELHHLERDKDVASAVLSNPYTRIVFRVGDGDSKKLAEGFGFFEARDLQNLETGQAICRIEKASGDFNLSIPLGEQPSQTEAAERRSQVITASKQKYAVSRKELEAEHARAFVQAEPTKNQTLPKSKPVDKPIARPEKFQNQEPPLTPEPTDSGSQKEAVIASPNAPQPFSQIIAETPKGVEAVAVQPKETAEPRDLGRGGEQHKAIQKRLKEAAETLGFRSTIEKEILEGKGSVDLYLEREGIIIACEIGITTTVDHEVGNVTKCLRADLPKIAFISSSEAKLRQMQEAVAAAVGREFSNRVNYFLPDRFIEELQRLSRADAQVPKQPAETVRRGYRVKRSAPKLTSEELRTKEAAALRLLAETMERE